MNKPQTRVFIEDLLIEIHLGHAEWEKHADKKWPLLVSVELFTDNTDWPDPTIDTIIDYSRVHDYVMGWETRPHVEFLETLIEELMEFCFKNPKVMTCRVRMKKPHLYPNASGAGVEVLRVRS